MSALGTYLLELRTYRGYTQDELAAQISVSDGVISGWERGKYQPAVDKISDLVEFLGGSLFDVARLVKRDATPEEGKMLAVLRCKNPVLLTDEERALFESLSPEKKQAILTLIRGQ